MIPSRMNRRSWGMEGKYPHSRGAGAVILGVTLFFVYRGRPCLFSWLAEGRRVAALFFAKMGKEARCGGAWCVWSRCDEYQNQITSRGQVESQDPGPVVHAS